MGCCWALAVGPANWVRKDPELTLALLCVADCALHVFVEAHGLREVEGLQKKGQCFSGAARNLAVS